MLTVALGLVALASTPRPAWADLVPLWTIGASDDRAAEFRHAPRGYREWDRDGVFVVGSSTSRADWPYVHPGPDDAWAGGRPHAFSILFGLDRVPDADCRLVIDLVDTHSATPPALVVDVNGHEHEHATPRGGGDRSIQGDAKAGREHRFAVEIPRAELQAGMNVVSIETARGSWMLYDSVAFEAPAKTKLVPTSGATIQSVDIEKWLWKRDSKVVQAATVRLLLANPARRWSLDVGGLDPIPLATETGVSEIALSLPPVAKETRRVVAVRDGDRILARSSLTQYPARLRQPADCVDPLLGTATSRWMLFPGPSAPFGLVNLSPNNQGQGWNGGHDYSIRDIACFSHLHSWTMVGLGTMPTTGELKIKPGTSADPDSGYRSRIRNETEVATSGYYAVTLDDYGVRAESTATVRCGFQRYTYPQSDVARILFDLKIPAEYPYRLIEAAVQSTSDREITGHATYQSRGINCELVNDYTLYFVARTSRPYERFGGWIGDRVIAGQGAAIRTEKNEDIGAFVEFAGIPANGVVTLQTGVSLVSVESARKNLELELGPFKGDFDACRAHARRVWNDLLGRIEVESDRPEDLTKFYTNFYRAYCARATYSDADGSYRDPFERVRRVKRPDDAMLGCDAFWNTFWNVNQLWMLATPDVVERWVRSLLEMYDAGGWLARGPTGLEYSGVMVASHEIALIVAAYQNGLRDFDVDKAWEAALHQQTVPGAAIPPPGGGLGGNRQLGPYLELGWVPVEAGHMPSRKAPASNTCEYAYDDWCVAQFAKALGKTAAYEQFKTRAGNWRHVFDPQTKYVRPRHADGRWMTPFDPLARDRWYAEGNAWQFTWFVPHDVRGLVDAMGRSVFLERLGAGFEQARSHRFAHPRYVNLGNQPNMQAPYLFNWAGEPWQTQKWVRAMLDEYFGTGPDGYPGDEDQGQMGAWFVLSAIGLFQMDGGCRVDPIWEIGSPLFDRVVIHLDAKRYRGKRFVIEARDNSPENVFVQSATLNGRPLDRPWFKATELFGGGELILQMGPQPNRAWGAGMDKAPPRPRW